MVEGEIGVVETMELEEGLSVVEMEWEEDFLDERLVQLL